MSKKPDQRERHEKHEGPRHRNLSGRNRPRPRALDAGIEVAVENVVPRATRPAHGDGADREQHEEFQIGPARAGGKCCEPGRPPAG
jgi:hypothetical protein